MREDGGLGGGGGHAAWRKQSRGGLKSGVACTIDAVESFYG